MGSACCVAARDKTIVPSRSAGETFQRNNGRYSPTWSFRWDNRVRVAGEDTSLSWLSDGISRNDGSDVKLESAFVSSDGSPLDSFRTQKSPASDLSVSRNTSMDVISEQMAQKAKDSVESVAPSCPSPTKLSLPPASQASSFSTSPLSSQSHLQPASSSHKLTQRSPAHRPHLSKQVSDSHFYGMNSPNRYSATEERPGTPWRNESRRGSSDGWSMNAFSELMAFSRRESWSYDNDSSGLKRDKIARHGSQTSDDQQTCGACSRPLSEKSFWSSQKIIASNELSVVAVLTCGHVYHAECLEHMTPETERYDPSCPICTLGEKKTLKLTEKALRAEMDLKARYNNKRLRNRVMDSDLDCDDLVMFDHVMGSAGHKGKGPKLASSSSMKSYSPKPFLMRHFSFGSKGSCRSTPENPPAKKKGFFWTKSSKT